MMTIHQCEQDAKALGFDKAVFKAIFPAGIMQCRWLDAYMGIFTIEGLNGFVTVNQIDKEYPNLRCFNLTEPKQDDEETEEK